MSSRYLPFDIPGALDMDRLRRTENPTAQLVKSLERIVSEYPPRDSYNARECHGLYSGPTSIAYMFLQLSRSHHDLYILGIGPKQWAEQYLYGKRIFSPVTPATNGTGSEALAFHVVRSAINQADSFDEQKLLGWMRPLCDTHEGRSFRVLLIILLLLAPTQN